VVALAGCGVNDAQVLLEGDEGEGVAEAPLLGADGKDAADRSCNIVLREVGRRSNNTGGYESACGTTGCYYVWSGSLEVSATAVAEGAKPYVLYQSLMNPTKWLQVTPTKVTGGAPGFVRYNFKIKKDTVSTGMSNTSLMRSRIQVSPFLRTTSSARLFDHNRLPGDFDVYQLAAENGWGIQDDAAVCAPPPANKATLEFQAGWTQAQHGALVAGGKLVVDYDLNRLTACRNSHNGFPAWDLKAHVRFTPGGQLADGTVRGFDAPTGTPQGPGIKVPLEVTIPAGATRAELWFENASGAGSTCVAWDSNNGQNYGFEVLPVTPSAVGWGGNFGGSFSRLCEHQDGLAEPMKVDDYVQQRACSFVDAEVYVPGLTDAAVAHPERILAQAEGSFDNKAAFTQWLGYVGKVGNNYRFRWLLPRDQMNVTPWNTLRYTFRFSTDGATWYRVGQGAGPAGGLQRSVEREPTWCNSTWATCAR
jgi:hypothetical protein